MRIFILNKEIKTCEHNGKDTIVCELEYRIWNFKWVVLIKDYLLPDDKDYIKKENKILKQIKKAIKDEYTKQFLTTEIIS